MSGATFSHKPLEAGQFRLLILQPSRSQDDLIECELFNCSLDNPPSYEALSYVWGDPLSTRVISMQGSTFPVTDNLYSALQALRQVEGSRTLWVDAICVNLADIEEKNDQVLRMPQIFFRADGGVVYLGIATAATDQSMDYLIQLEKQEGKTGIVPKIEFSDLSDRDGDARLEGLRDMLSRPWFRKVWVAQEIGNARSAVVYCGSKAVSGDTIARVVEILRIKINPMGQGFLDLMPGPRRDLRADSKFQLYDLLQMLRYGEATDPRDKVFAALNLAADNSKRTIVPDYSMSQTALIKKVLASLYFCELACVPISPYHTIDEFLANLDQIDNHVVEKILESSKEIDLESLLRYGSHYINIDHNLIEAAGRNETRGKEMVRLLVAKIDQDGRASPTPSVASSVWSDVSAPSTNTSYPPEDVEISFWHLVKILGTQDAFSDLCHRGFSRDDLKPERFANNLRRMFKTFGRSLSNEAPSYTCQLAAKLILRDSRRMAAQIRARYDPDYQLRPRQTHPGEACSRSRVEDFIRQLNSQHTEMAEQSPGNDSDSEDDSTPNLPAEPALVSSLTEVEAFILSSRSFETLLNSLTAFLEPRVDRGESSLAAVPNDAGVQPAPQRLQRIESNQPLSMPEEQLLEQPPALLPELELSRDSVGLRVYERLSNWLTRIERPKEGVHRIQYTCGCGEPMFVDVKELRPGGIERFRNELMAPVVGPQERVLVESGGGDPGLPRIPQRAYVAASSSSSDGTSSLSLVPDGIGLSGQSGDFEIEIDGLQRAQPGDSGSEPLFLLLCINTRNLTKLLHVDLRYIQNDQYLFDAIRRKYWESRQIHSWHYGLLTPRWLADRIPTAWREWLGTLHLRVPRSAEFIEFRLVPFHTSICPDKVRPGLPPVEQVKVQRNYLYEPFPTDVEVLSIPKFSHLLKPGAHHYDFWLKTIPKKLRTELVYRPAVVGWGLMVHEDWDWVIVLSNFLALMIIFGIGVVVYAALSHDPSSAFGFGAYGMAVVTLLITIKYWAWQEREVS